MEEQAMVNEAKPVNPSLENQLEKSGQMAIVEARSMVIENKQDYEQAGKFLVEIKTRAKQIKDYWAPTKAAAKAAHQSVVDREKEMERLKKEQDRLTKEIARCQGMLSNPNFVNKAPEAKVNAEKEKLQKYEEMMEKVKTQLTQMDK